MVRAVLTLLNLFGLLFEVVGFLFESFDAVLVRRTSGQEGSRAGDRCRVEASEVCGAGWRAHLRVEVDAGCLENSVLA